MLEKNIFLTTLHTESEPHLKKITSCQFRLSIPVTATRERSDYHDRSRGTETEKLMSGSATQTENSVLLAGADAEDLGATGRAGALGGGATILHFNGLGSLDFSLGATLYTISLHVQPPTTKLHSG